MKQKENKKHTWGRKVLSLAVLMGMLFSLSACGHEHTWVDATCTEPQTCSECGKTEGEALGHTWVDATCTAPKTCSVCGETEGEALGHTWVDATCTEPKTCSVCGETEGEALGHTISEWTVSKEATCSEEGEETGTCSVCGETVQQTLEKLEHTPGEWVVTTEATSSSAGVRTQYCEVCGEELATEEFTLSDEEIEEQYKENCTEYSYDTIARDPDEYYGTYGKYKGEVVQVLEDGDDVQLRVNITEGKYSYSDTIFVFYEKKDGESRILEDDIITLYGINMGTVSYESVLGATITLPCVYAAYIDIA
ncbi:MAG: hypothetical protein LUG64_04205 [Clostridiales bacterium]|nr:hypothetical protein [Clostridiales bacterium]